jgi:soluble lytic murein transglycosylase-like protein
MRFCFRLSTCSALALGGLWGTGLEQAPARATWVVRADARTGRLVRTLAMREGAVKTAAPSGRVVEAVEQTARRHNLDPLLVHSVIEAESNYDPFAVSPKGALGLMQLMPSTARRFGVTNSFNYAENIEGGGRYLRYLLDLFQDEKLAVAAYNAGEQAVLRHRGVPPYAETQDYVRIVTRKYATAKQAAAGSAPRGADEAPKLEPEYRPIEQFVDARGNLYMRTR